MEKIRPILYGVADYAQIRRKNAWFVDRTAKLRGLEGIVSAVFLRPRRNSSPTSGPSASFLRDAVQMAAPHAGGSQLVATVVQMAAPSTAATAF